MMRTALALIAALAAAPAFAEECAYKSKSGAELWFADPLTLIVSEDGKQESCRLLSAGTGIVLSRGVDCDGRDPTRIEFSDEEMNSARFRGAEWLWTCPAEATR